MTSAIFSAATGIIQSTVSPSLTNAAQISALQAQGLGVIEVQPNVNGSNAMVDLSNNTITPLSPTPAIPNLLVQFVAAQINSRAVDSTAFHPNTLAEMHTALAAASMTGISAAVAAPASTSTAAPAS